MPVANRIKVANDRLIFREDFRNPALAAANGLIVSGCTWFANGGIFANGSITHNDPKFGPRDSFTFIINTNVTPFTGNYRILMALRTGGLLAYGFAFNSNSNRLACVSSFSGYGVSSVDVDIGFSTLVMAKSGSSATFYQNGAQKGSSVTTPYQEANQPLILTIGSTVSTRYLNEQISQARVYNYAMSADEIKQDYLTIRGSL